MSTQRESYWLPATSPWQTTWCVVTLAVPGFCLFPWTWVVGLSALYIVFAFRFPLGVTVLSFGLGITSILWLASLGWYGDTFSRVAIGGLFAFNIAALAVVFLKQQEFVEGLVNSVLNSRSFYFASALFRVTLGILILALAISASTATRDNTAISMLEIAMVPAGCCCLIGGIMMFRRRNNAA